MNGPQYKIIPSEKMDKLSLSDLMILKSFLEKAIRNNLFLSSEKQSAILVHTKLRNLINKIYKKQQLTNQTSQSGSQSGS